MKNSKWIDAAAACEIMGVKPATLYSYVSRSNVRVRTDTADPRRSLYALADIEALHRKSRRPRARSDIAQGAIRWGEPLLETAISEVRDGMLWLRGRAVTDCAETMSLEDVAALLLDVPFDVYRPQDTAETGPTAFARAMAHLAREAGAAEPMGELTEVELARDAGALLSRTADACIRGCHAGLIHQRLAVAWGVDGGAAETLRLALVLLSDHELNPSTFAVRVCASTGASLPAALLAGMATLSGVRHGTTSELAAKALELGDGAIDQFGTLDPYRFGFGHPLYPEGDPRGAMLMGVLPPHSKSALAVRALSERLGLAPNVDMALTAVCTHLKLPLEAPHTIFAVARLAGWAAHAIEQAARVDIIRPRSRYTRR
ncbi:MAG: citrate synthase [Pseudomonadota bacterium]